MADASLHDLVLDKLVYAYLRSKPRFTKAAKAFAKAFDSVRASEAAEGALVF